MFNNAEFGLQGQMRRSAALVEGATRQGRGPTVDPDSDVHLYYIPVHTPALAAGIFNSCDL